MERKKGFAFSVDAALAAILFISVILAITSLSDHPFSLSTVSINQLSSDLFFTLNKTGFLLTELDANAPSIALQNIYSKSIGLLPSGFDMQLRLTEYDLNESTCQSQKTFDSCFSETFSAINGNAPPQNSTVFHGKRVFVKRQPSSDCNTTFIELSESGLENYFGPLYFQDQNFAELVEFDVNVSPPGPIACDQNITVTLTVEVPDTVRRPVDMMLVIDRSGSMSWSGQESSGDADAVWVDGNTAFIDNGTAIYSLDVSNPLIPAFLDSAGNPESTVSDVHGRSGTLFAGETTDDLFSFNSSNPSNISFLDTLSFDDIWGLFASGNYVYLAADGVGGGDSDGLYVVNANSPSNLSETDNVALSLAEDVFVLGNTAYVARLGSGITTVDVSNPNNIATLDTVDPGGTSEGVFVEGNYAYVAVGNTGLAIIDVADPSNIFTVSTLAPTPTGYSYNIFKQGNEVFIADGDSLDIVDVTDPQNPFLARTFNSPYNYQDIYVQGDYAFLASNQALITVDIFDGPRINNAKTAATAFLDFNGWTFPPDQIGLASFNTSSTTDQTLSSDVNLVKSDINSLVASGGTNIESGIDAANIELQSVRANPNALKFEILLSDGQSTTGNSASAAQDANNAGIIIYTIAFGADADVDELQTIADITGGQMYLAEDENALLEVFELISAEIAEIAQDSNVTVPIGDGEIIIDEGEGILIGDDLVFDTNDLEPGQPWVGSYVVNFPCNAAANCDIDAVTFPGEGTTFTYVDSNGVVNTIDFNASITLDFYNRDLTLDVFGGEVVSPTEVYLDVNVINAGDLNTSQSVLNFYLNDLNGPLLATETVPPLCGENDVSCSSYFFELYEDTEMGQTGLIYAVVNDDNSVSECPLNNYEAVYCLESPSTQYYLLEYWVWKT